MNGMIDATKRGVLGNGTTDDGPRLQAIADDLVDTGGTIWLPPNRVYAIGTQVLIRSYLPIHIVSEMGCPNVNDLTKVTNGFIKPIAALADGMFKWIIPAGATANSTVGGSAHGLAFYDISGAGIDNPGTHEIHSAIHFAGNFYGRIQHCYFFRLKGRAMFFSNATSHVNHCGSRYCGDVNKPCIEVGGESVAFVYLRKVNIEQHYDAPYIKSNAGTGLTLRDCSCEALPAVAAQQQTFVDATGALEASDCVFSRNDAVQVIMRAPESTLDNCRLKLGSAQTTPQVQVIGAHSCKVTNNFFNGAFSTDRCIEATGSDHVRIIGNLFNFTGAIHVNSGCRGAIVSNNQLRQCSTSGTVAQIDVQSSWSAISGNVVDGVDASAVLGIFSAGTNCTITGNTVSNLNNAAGIQSNGANSTISGNVCVALNGGKGIFAFGSGCVVSGNHTDSTHATPYDLANGTRAMNNGGNVGTATAAAGAVTLQKEAGIITTEALTTAAGADYTLVFTNKLFAAGSQLNLTIHNGTNTIGPLALRSITYGAGTATVVIRNGHASNALDGTLKLNFQVVNP